MSLEKGVGDEAKIDTSIDGVGEKEHEVTSLIVEREGTMHPSHLSDDEQVEVRNLTVGRRDAEVGYYNLHNLSNTQKLEIYMRDDNKVESVDLPEDMLDRIAVYMMKENRARDFFDCSKFVELANGKLTDLLDVDDEDYYNNFFKKWEIAKFEADKIKPGETIMLTDLSFKDGKTSNVMPKHFAIYLGHGLYLSKAGYRDRLMVTTMDQMVNCFGGEYIFKLI